MNRVGEIGSLLKKIYRFYGQDLLEIFEKKGFMDLRPSFIEILLFVCENEGASIKTIGHYCGLKKQTMTSHLNELVKRGYLYRQTSNKDKREQLVYLTDFGKKFKFGLLEAYQELEKRYIDLIGEVEIDRTLHILKSFLQRIRPTQKSS